MLPFSVLQLSVGKQNKTDNNLRVLYIVVRCDNISPLFVDIYFVMRVEVVKQKKKRASNDALSKVTPTGFKPVTF